MAERIRCPACKGLGCYVWPGGGSGCWVCVGHGAIPAERTLHEVTLTLCDLCINGAGGYCNTPGCYLCRNAGPDIPVMGGLEGLRELGAIKEAGDG